MYSDEYSSLFFKKSGYRPEELVKAWNSLVRSIEDGYDDLEPELDNDLDVREQIDSLIADGELRQFEHDHRQFIADITSIDVRLKQMIFDNPVYSNVVNKKWWQMIILKKGRSKYYEEILELYNIKIELVN